MVDSALTPEQLDASALEMADNADSLAADAAVLLAHGHWRGSYVLATLALEEIGKAWSLQHPGTSDERVAVFQKIRRDHVRKLQQAREFAAFVYQFLKNPDADGRRVIDVEAIYDETQFDWAEEEHDIRMSGAYVDLLEGWPTGGHAAVTERQAREQFDRAHALVHLVLVYLRTGSEDHVVA